jgi:hypothetical protein
MNLEQANTMSQLSVPNPVKTVKDILSSTRVAFQILARCEAGGYPYKNFPVNRKGAKAWAKKFLTSKDFQLMRINLNAAASPHNPRDPKRVKFYVRELAAKGVPDFDPLVVDVNRRKEGRTHLGYIPDVIVCDGKHRKASMLASGITHYWAWVGIKATKKMKPKDIKACADTIYLPPCDGTKVMSQYEIMASTVPAVSPPRQDAGSGGSRPKDHLHSGGPGSGRKPGSGRVRVPQQIGRGPSEIRKPRSDRKTSKAEDKWARSWGLEAGKVEDCNACGARSTGSLEPGSASDNKVPPDQSDAGSRTEASDQLKWNPRKSQPYTPGTGPGYADQFGLSEPAAYMNNIGPRVLNRGASRSEMSRSLNAFGSTGLKPEKTNFDVDAEKKIGKLWTKKKKKLKADTGVANTLAAKKGGK